MFISFSCGCLARTRTRKCGTKNRCVTITLQGNPVSSGRLPVQNAVQNYCFFLNCNVFGSIFSILYWRKVSKNFGLLSRRKTLPFNTPFAQFVDNSVNILYRARDEIVVLRTGVMGLGIKHDSFQIMWERPAVRPAAPCVMLSDIIHPGQLFWGKSGSGGILNLLNDAVKELYVVLQG